MDKLNWVVLQDGLQALNLDTVVRVIVRPPTTAGEATGPTELTVDVYTLDTNVHEFTGWDAELVISTFQKHGIMVKTAASSG